MQTTVNQKNTKKISFTVETKKIKDLGVNKIQIKKRDLQDLHAENFKILRDKKKAYK